MITRKQLAAMGAAVLLTASLGLAQTKTTTKPPAAAKPAATTHVTNGTIESVSGTGDAMTVVVKGSKSSDKPVTLMLNASTTKTGELTQGAKVTAHYRVDNGQNIATSISATAPKAAASAAKPATSAPKK